MNYTRTRSLSVVDGMTDDERTSSYQGKFGDVAAYHLMPPNPEYRNTRRLNPPNNGFRFTLAEWSEFLQYVQLSGCKIKASFIDGQILIEECQMHGIHEAGLNVFVGTVYQYNRTAVGMGDDALEARGQSNYSLSRSFLMPDATWTPRHGVTPSIFFEIGNSQEPENLLDKVGRVMRHSRNNRYVIIVKVWRAPVPEQVAMVVAVWLKTHNAAQGIEWRAIKFTSFGNMPPTNAELADFPVTPGNRPWVPALDGVIEGPGSIPCDMGNSALPVFTLTLLPVHMFNVPNIATPNDLLNLNVLDTPLFLVKRAVVRGMVVDILDSLWILTNAEYGVILNNNDAQINYPRLYQFALQRFQQPLF